MRTVRSHLRDLFFGVFWFAALFTWDAVDSWLLINRSTRRIRTDEQTVELLKGAITEFVTGCSLAYLVMGLMAGITLALVQRVLHTERPGFFVWLSSAFSWFTIATILGIARQMVTFPALYPWFPKIAVWAETAEPWWMDIGWCVFALSILNLGWRRWKHVTENRFIPRTAQLAVWCAALALLLQPLSPDEAEDNEGMNLVLIGVDALRPDRLGFFGHDRDTSPHIDEFLEDALIFEQAFTQLPRTYPAWITMLTGTWPTTHGIRDNLPTAERLVPKPALLARVMKDAGFATGFATDDSRFSYMVPETGFDLIRQPDVGLQNFAISVNEPRFRAFHGLLHNRVGFSLVPVQAYNQAFGASYRPGQFVDYAVDGLAQLSQNERFFYALHSCVLHVPGDRAYPWYRMFGQNGYKGPNRFKYSSTGSSLVVNDVEDAKGERARNIAEQDQRIYDSGILMADDLVGAVMAELEQSGLIDNTIVVLFSDHGEEIWEPDLPYKWRGPNHGFHVYGDGHTNVLMAVRFPDGAHAGKRVSDPVRLIDMAPTFAELFDLDWPNEIDGKSMMAVARGEEDAPRPVYIETGLSEPRYWVPGHKKYPFKKVSKRYKVDPETGQVHIRSKFLNHLIAAKDRALQLGEWKLVWHAVKRGIRVELYDHFKDPYNRIDLSELHPEKVEELGTLLLPFLENDGIKPPPVDTWVEKSRKKKMSDGKFRRRMKRNGGQLGPVDAETESSPDTTLIQDGPRPQP